jgi:hypothetical protein
MYHSASTVTVYRAGGHNHKCLKTEVVGKYLNEILSGKCKVICASQVVFLRCELGSGDMTRKWTGMAVKMGRIWWDDFRESDLS